MAQKIKCVVWDLDNTLWDGVLIEDENVVLKKEAAEVIKILDERGILQSISSKNNLALARKKLQDFGLWDYFIYPQINWNSKSEAVGEVAKSINIGKDTLAFVDDQIFERDEVLFAHPEVMCIDSKDIGSIPSMERMVPRFVTDDSKNRRQMYMSDIVRNNLEKDFEGTKEEFLKTLDMQMTITEAEEKDLQRMEELTVRTHQLNSTGFVYSYDELKEMTESERYIVLVMSLKDKYGEYGKVGLSVIEKNEEYWEIKLLLMSCRVMSKGVGNVMMNYIINLAREKKVSLRALFVGTDRNRVMYITYKFAGYKEISKENDITVFEADMSFERTIPEYVKLNGGEI